jgi:hypothetical protein
VRVSQAAGAGVASQEPGPGLQVSAEAAEGAEGGGRPVAGLGDLRLGRDGFGAGVEVGELRTGGGTVGEVLARRREVAAAQLGHRQHAVRGRGVPVRAEGRGDIQGRPGVRGGGGQAAVGQVDAGAQHGQRRLGWDVLQCRVICGAEDILGRVELAQVDQGGGEREQRLDLTGIRADPGTVPCRIMQQLERVADLAAVPADDRAGDTGRRGGGAVVLGVGSQDAVGDRAGEFVAQPGQGL